MKTEDKGQRKIAVGQTVFYQAAERRYRRPDAPELEEHQVQKVGRKWIEFGGQWFSRRFDKTTMRTDGWPRGRVWLSREDYEDETARDAAWLQLREFVTGGYGGNVERVSRQQIEAALEALGLEVKA
jgi:hypothetical protein